MRVFLMLALVVVFSSCVRNKNGVAVQNTKQATNHVFEVTEVVQATSYTYMKVKENMMERWVAVNKVDANVGDVYYYDQALQMTDFTSKDLNRTFDVIYFLNQISKTPLVQQPAMAGGMQAHTGKVKVDQNNAITLDKNSDELTIGKIYGNKADFSEKEVEIRGVVVKVNNDIMGKNWVHIQDGTSNNSSFDLAVTTLAKVNKGDEVTFKGKIILDKDYGAGYTYDVIMTDADLVDSKAANVKM